MPDQEKLGLYFDLRDQAVEHFHAYSSADPSKQSRENLWQRYVRTREGMLKAAAEATGKVYRPLMIVQEKNAELRVVRGEKVVSA